MLHLSCGILAYLNPKCMQWSPPYTEMNKRALAGRRRLQVYQILPMQNFSAICSQQYTKIFKMFTCVQNIFFIGVLAEVYEGVSFGFKIKHFQPKSGEKNKISDLKLYFKNG